MLHQRDVEQLVAIDHQRRPLTGVVGRRAQPVPRRKGVDRLDSKVLQMPAVHQQPADGKQPRIFKEVSVARLVVCIDVTPLIIGQHRWPDHSRVSRRPANTLGWQLFLPRAVGRTNAQHPRYLMRQLKRGLMALNRLQRPAPLPSSVSGSSAFRLGVMWFLLQHWATGALPAERLKASTRNRHTRLTTLLRT